MTTPALRLLHNAMQAYSWRLKGLASNVAQLDTPGAARTSVRFEDALQRARRGGPGAATPDDVTARAVQEARPPQLEDELMELADTQMRAQLTARALSGQFSLLRTGITGRTA